MATETLSTDHAGQLRYWANHVAGQAEPMRSHLLAAAQELEQLQKDKAINTTNAATIERLRSQLELLQGRCAMLAALHYGKSGTAVDAPGQCTHSHPDRQPTDQYCRDCGETFPVTRTTKP